MSLRDISEPRRVILRTALSMILLAWVIVFARHGWKVYSELDQINHPARARTPGPSVSGPRP